MIDFYIDSHCGDTAGFSSGYKAFDDYLRCRYDESVIHYIMETDTDRLIAYFALVASALPYSDEKGSGALSAIELKMFALDKRHQGTGLAAALFDEIIETVEYYATEYIGAKIIVLYSVPVDYVVELYRRNGFQEVGGSFRAFATAFTEGCIPMFKTL